MAKSSSANAGNIVFAIAIEAVGVGALVLIAGINDNAANIALVVMAGLFLLWMIKHESETAAFSNFLGRIEKAGIQ